jgi:hypothetical protein
LRNKVNIKALLSLPQGLKLGHAQKKTRTIAGAG